jgi:hypothetical protein
MDTLIAESKNRYEKNVQGAGTAVYNACDPVSMKDANLQWFALNFISSSIPSAIYNPLL